MGSDLLQKTIESFDSKQWRNPPPPFHNAGERRKSCRGADVGENLTIRKKISYRRGRALEVARHSSYATSSRLHQCLSSSGRHFE